jgi:hypothetical protein
VTVDAGRRTTNAKWQMMNGRWQVTVDAGRRTTNANRQGFSHREADAKSLLDEAFRRGMGGAAAC